MTHPELHHFASSHGDICYFEWGVAGGGPSILLLHATGFHARCWDQVVAAFPAGIGFAGSGGTTPENPVTTASPRFSVGTRSRG